MLLPSGIFPIPRYKDGRTPVITSGWDDARDGGSRRHEGIDIFYKREPEETLLLWFPWLSSSGKYFNTPGTPVLAASGGRVKYAKLTSRGGSVRIEHGPIDTYYTHMASYQVREGDWVNAGDVLGYVGDDPSNPSDPAHLHFGMYYPGSGTAIDPEPESQSWTRVEWPFIGLGLMAALTGLGYAIYRYWKR